MTNVGFDRKSDGRRVKRFCRSRATDSPAVLCACVLRNRFSLGSRTIWVSRTNGLRELYDVLLVGLLAGKRSLLSRDLAFCFVAEAFFFRSFKGA
jgi:hypothetical protein